MPWSLPVLTAAEQRDAGRRLPGRRRARPDGRVAAGACPPAPPSPPTATPWTSTGYLLLPATADPHAHLDKALLLGRHPAADGRPRHRHRRLARLRRHHDRGRRRRAGADSGARPCWPPGTTAVRTHVDIRTGDDPTLRRPRPGPGARASCAALMDLELVALAGPDTTRPRPSRRRSTWASTSSAGARHLAADPLADMARLLAIAERRGRRRRPARRRVASTARSPSTPSPAPSGAGRANVTAGHCCRLGTLPAGERARVIAEVLASDVGVIANPITNLYLQGWEHPTSHAARADRRPARCSTPGCGSPRAPTTCATRSTRWAAATPWRRRCCSSSPATSPSPRPTPPSAPGPATSCGCPWPAPVVGGRRRPARRPRRRPRRRRGATRPPTASCCAAAGVVARTRELGPVGHALAVEPEPSSRPPAVGGPR